MAIQPIEFIHKNHLSFIEGCIIKYTCRYKAKDGVEDLKKIKHYVDLLIELKYPLSNTGCLKKEGDNEK
jgi:hypothetical protein